MLYQQDDPELYYNFFTINEQFTSFIKSSELIEGRFKVIESTSVQGPQSSEKGVVVRERDPSRTEIPQVVETVINGNYASFGQARNDGFSDNRQ